MQSDLRGDPLFKRARDLTRAWLRSGTGQASTLTQLTASPDGRTAAGAAPVCDTLEGVPPTRIALVDLGTGEMDVVTHGPNSDSQPRWSPDGRALAFLSDREQVHVNRLRLLDVASGADRETASIDGFVEYLHWSPDGATILLGVAGHGSDLAGALGAFAVEAEDEGDAPPSWAPTIEGNVDAIPWRSVWLYDIAADSARQISPPGVNVWEAVWCGPDHVAAICSDEPEETWWYSADVRLIEIATGAVRPLFTPADQLGWLAASPSGATVAVVEAVCSDRMIVAGDLRLIDVATDSISRPETLRADVVHLHWRDESRIAFAAAQGPNTLIGLLDTETGDARELWRGEGRTPLGMMFAEIAPLGDDPETLLFVCESFFEAPTLLVLEGGRERIVRRFVEPEAEAAVRALGTARDFRWTAPDGLDIHGWLVTPPGPGPHPVVMHVHGGPVWYARPLYLGRSPLLRMMLEAGYALFQPNPRGSSGRGQAFARRVFGDMGGADTQDFLSGLDALEAAGLIDRDRIGVTGGSYGGYMTSWLITQDQRFAAAVSLAPVTDWVSQHLTCNVASFCEMFLDADIDDPAGKYFTRSPVHFADRVRTPTLHISGGQDRITPAGQALEFHRALRAAGVKSVLAEYPLEGHGIRTMPASFDYAARMIAWFGEHMPARQSRKE